VPQLLGKTHCRRWVKALARAELHVRLRHTRVLGFAGGFVDALGGGWGPVVTSALLAGGHAPRLAIGSVNLAEVPVAVAQSAVFAAVLGLVHLDIVAGLILGGVAAAPFAAYTTRRLPARLLVLLVGAVVVAVSLRNLLTGA
jgi:hypothetical protein